MGKKGLGRGIQRLIPKIEEETVTTIDLELIDPNETQPRRDFDPERLEELAQSIKAHGVVQPILLTKVGSRYKIVAGERRFRAAQMVGLKDIPALIKELNELQIQEIALIENIQREDLNPIEQAIAFKTLIEDHKITQEELSERLGKSRSSITNTLRLLKLPKRGIDLIISGKISSGHGRALLAFEDEEEIERILNLIEQDNLSVREVEELAQGKTKTFKPKSPRTKMSSEYDLIEKRISSALKTKVSITKGKRKGKIEISFKDEEELDRLLNRLEGIR